MAFALEIKDHNGRWSKMVKHEEKSRGFLLWNWLVDGELEDASDEEYIELLSAAWCHDELPSLSLGHLWLELFEHAGYFSDDDSPKPTEPLTLYRSCGEDGLDEGYSWTTSQLVAFKFLFPFQARMQYLYGTDYSEKERKMYKVVAKPEQLLAHFTCRGEDEYVMDSWGLDVEEVFLTPEQVAEFHAHVKAS